MTADGPLRGEITEQVARAGLADRVRFTGILNLEEIRRSSPPATRWSCRA